MHIIAQGNTDLRRLITAKPRVDSIYKLSRFVLRKEAEDGLLLYNVLNGVLVFLSSNESRMLQNLPGKMPAGTEDLVTHSFFVPVNLDETKRVEQLRKIMLRRLAVEGYINTYDILPTTNCNARCFYCFESDIKHVSMSEKTANELIEFIKRHRGDNPVHLQWFGGEPTLGIKRIDQICTALTDGNIPFSSSMVSNAYLFDQDLVRHAKTCWNLQEIQVTLDGTEEVYNRTKAYISVNDNPFIRVLRNIKLLIEEKIHVTIRLNMDTHNVENLSQLIDELGARFQGSEFINVYVRQLNQDVGFNPISHSEHDLFCLRKNYLHLKEKLSEHGWGEKRNAHLPVFCTVSCMADNPSTIQCTPDGVFSKCENEIYESAVGSLKEGITNEKLIQYWQEREPHPECKDCAIYPACIHTLKHCLSWKNGCMSEDRAQALELSHEAILNAYNNWKKTSQENVTSSSIRGSKFNDC